MGAARYVILGPSSSAYFITTPLMLTHTHSTRRDFFSGQGTWIQRLVRARGFYEDLDVLGFASPKSELLDSNHMSYSLNSLSLSSSLNSEYPLNSSTILPYTYNPL